MEKINNIVNDIFLKARKAYKKPVLVRIDGPVTEDTEINTWESDKQIAKPGHYIVTGIKGEKYPIPESVFHDYEPVQDAGENMYRKKKKIVFAYKVNFSGVVETISGELLEFKPGYYIVMESDDNMWAVDGEVFEEAYEII